MDEQGSDQNENNVYSFKAPQENIHPEDNDETGAIVGAISACIIVSAVLFFLWKMLQKKQKEMKQQNLMNVEVATKAAERGGDDETIEEDEVRNNRRKLHTNKTKQKQSKWTAIQIPHSTMRLDHELEDLASEEHNAEELILPNLSPIASCSWSQQEESTSSDTGYISGLCKKHGESRNRPKAQYNVYVEHSRNILQSLKNRRVSIIWEQQIREEKVQNVKKILNNCENFIQSTKKKISTRSEKNNQIYEAAKKIRQTRKTRELQKLKWKLVEKKRSTMKAAEAFFAMQVWFEGLHLHVAIREIGEEIFLLRSYHDSDWEQNEFQKKCIRDCDACLRKCLESIAKIKAKIQRWRYGIRKRRLTDDEVCQDDVTTLPGATRTESNTRSRVMLPRLPQDGETRFIQRPSQSEFPDNDEKQNEGSRRCSQCHRYVCNCSKNENIGKNGEANSEKLFSFQSSKNKIPIKLHSGMQDCEPNVTSNELEENTPPGAHSSGFYTIKLMLREASLQEHSSISVSDKHLSEREVHKALQRVPYITSLNSVIKDEDNNWTIVAASSQKRVANIRFNCRKKAYVIGMMQ